MYLALATVCSIQFEIKLLYNVFFFFFFVYLFFVFSRQHVSGKVFFFVLNNDPSLGKMELGAMLLSS